MAQSIKDQGLLELGWNYINLDDCWGVRDNTTHEIMGAPERFPEGMPAFIAKIHGMGFHFGLYTDWGEKACHFPFVGSWPYYAQDAQTFADWKVDLVKFDGCNEPKGYTPEQLTKNFTAALDATGVKEYCELWALNPPPQATRCGSTFTAGAHRRAARMATPSGLRTTTPIIGRAPPPS